MSISRGSASRLSVSARAAFSRAGLFTRVFRDAREAIVADQIAIAEVAAPTGHEQQRATVIARRLARQGGSVLRCDDAGNVIARLPSSEQDSEHDDDGLPPVIVMAHLDTVFADVDVVRATQDGDRISAPGISDNGRGLAALLALHGALQDPRLAAIRAHPIELVATVGEEGAGNLRGATHFFDARALRAASKPVAVIALDGPGDAMVVHHGIASRRMRVTFDGPGGHPWADRHVPNAADALGRAVGALAQLADAERAKGAGASVTVTRVHGGESLTSIPARAWFELDVRTLNATRLPALLDEVLYLIERAQIDSSRPDQPLARSIDIIGDRPGGALDASHPLVQLANDATRWHDIEPQCASASTDANVPLSRGIPAITIGAGGVGGGAHTLDEWYEDADGARGLSRALAIIAAAAHGVLPPS